MANISGHDSGLVVKSIEGMTPPKPKKKPNPAAVTCSCCGFEFTGSYAQIKKRFATDVYDDGEKGRTCIACSNFFGMGGGGRTLSNGYTNVSPESTKSLFKRAKEDKYITLLKTMNFAGTKTGVDFTVDFADIFRVKRVGTVSEPTGQREDVFKRFTIDIEVGLETLTLYPHEFGVISWVEIMQNRQEGLYEEAYLCAEDKEGYFKPTKEGRELINNTFGAR